jgi:hypothetical protein
MATQGPPSRPALELAVGPVSPRFFFVCFYSLVHTTLPCKYCISPSACNTLGYTRNPRCAQFQKKIQFGGTAGRGDWSIPGHRVKRDSRGKIVDINKINKNFSMLFQYVYSTLA